MPEGPHRPERRFDDVARHPVEGARPGVPRAAFRGTGARGTGPLRDEAASIERVLTPLLRESPAAIASLLRHPHVSTLVRVLRSQSAAEVAGVTPLGTELLALVAFDLAWRGALSTPVTLRRLPRRLVSLAARVALDFPAGTSAATFENGKITWSTSRVAPSLSVQLAAVDAGAEHAWISRPYRDLRGGIVLALADNNPLSSIEAHPDKEDAQHTVDLGGHPEEEWIASITRRPRFAHREVPARHGRGHRRRPAADRCFHPAHRRRGSTLSSLVPAGRHRDVIYLSRLHPPGAAADVPRKAIIHEVSHNKLNALFDLDPIIENGRGELYTSPIRPDPRPIHGVLLAVHAFVPVACMYERMSAALGDPEARRFAERYAAVVRSNHAGTSVLEAHARPTRIGKGLLDEISEWARHFR